MKKFVCSLWLMMALNVIDVHAMTVDEQYEDAMTILPNTLISPPGDAMHVYKLVMDQSQTIVFNGDYVWFPLQNDEGQVVAFIEQNHRQVTVEAGTYYVNVGSTSPFSYELLPAKNGEEIERNDSMAQARTLEEGDVLAGKFHHRDDVDYVKLDVREKGFVHLHVPSQPMRPKTYTFYDEAGNVVTKFAPNEDDVTLALNAGTYYMKMQANFEQSTYNVSYTVEPSHAAVVWNDPKPLLTLHKTFVDHAPSAISSDRTYTFIAQEAGYYEFIVTKQDIQTYKTIALFITDAQGRHLGDARGYTDDVYTQQIGLAKGEYTVTVKAPTDYTIRAIKHERYAEQEPNDLIQFASPLLLNQFTVGQISNVDYYTFTVAKDEVLSWNFTSDAGIPLHVRIVNAQASHKADVDTKGRQIRGSKTFKKGTYIVAVRAEDVPVQKGTYSIQIQQQQLLFRDVPRSHRYYTQIDAMRARGIITGYEDGSFRPNAPMKRHHVAAMIVRTHAPALQAVEVPFPFPDVPVTHSNYAAIQQLVASGIVNANAHGFSPEGTITRAQMAKILVEAFDQQPITPTQPTFHDVAPSDWYYVYAETLAYYGISTGDNGYFKPNEPLTRQHFAVFLARMLQL